MDLDDLMERPAVSDAALTMVVHDPGPPLADDSLNRAMKLLEPRRRGDEILFLSSRPIPTHWPAQRAGLRIRWRMEPDPSSGEALRRALADARRPVVAVADPQVSWTPGLLKEFLVRLDAADVVVGLRGRANRRIARWSTIPIRWWYSVQTADPCCPLQLLRTSALRDVLLECCGPLTLFELQAKASYLSCLVDEVPIPEARASASLWRAAAANWRSLMTLAVRPKFWDLEAHAGGFRAPTYELTAAPPAEPARRQDGSKWAQLSPRSAAVGLRPPMALRNRQGLRAFLLR